MGWEGESEGASGVSREAGASGICRALEVWREAEEAGSSCELDKLGVSREAEASGRAGEEAGSVQGSRLEEAWRQWRQTEMVAPGVRTWVGVAVPESAMMGVTGRMRMMEKGLEG